MEARARDILLYDDGCPLCTFQVRSLTWLDWRHTIRLVALSHPLSREVAPTLDAEQLRAAIHCVTPEGRIHRGARAIRHLSLRVPLLIPIGLFLWLPGVIRIAEWIYVRVSANRHLLSRWFGCKEACSVMPARQREGDVTGVGSGDA